MAHLHPDVIAARRDHTRHRGYLVPECDACTSPEAIRARRMERRHRLEAREAKRWQPAAELLHPEELER